MRAAVLALLLATPSGAAFATPVTVVMTGTWDGVEDPGGVLGSAVAVGTPFSATFVYDDGTPDSNPDPNIGNYLIPANAFSFTLSTGEFIFQHATVGPREIDVLNLSSGDSVLVYAETFTGSPGLPAFGLSYANPGLDDPAGTILSSAALVGLPWTNPGWDSAMSFFADIADGNPNTFFDLEGSVAQIVVVPEPSTATFVTLGLVAIAAGCRRSGTRAA